jgi:lysophospholipase L1-like esterase
MKGAVALKTGSATSAAVYSGVLLLLLAIQQGVHLLPNRGLGAVVRTQVAQARGRRSWKDSNGYYENLMGQMGDERIRPIELVLQGRRPWGPWEPDLYNPASFLVYEAKPNLHVVHPEEGPVETNSYGFFDREHSLRKPAGTIRIATFGDSIARGWGIPMDQRFDRLLENRLNHELGPHFEVLNFALPGYRLTQTLDVALEKAPAWQPDIYLVTLTELSVGDAWGEHVAQLVESGEDLKYDVLRDIVRSSGLRQGDDPALDQVKLAPYRFAAVRSVLLQLKSHAEQQSAKLIVVLLPDAEDVAFTERRFSGVRALLAGTGIPVVDLLDTFDGIDVDRIRVYWYDPHPDAAGHRMIADELYRKLREQPEAWAALSGQPSSHVPK